MKTLSSSPTRLISSQLHVLSSLLFSNICPKRVANPRQFPFLKLPSMWRKCCGLRPHLHFCCGRFTLGMQACQEPWLIWASKFDLLICPNGISRNLSYFMCTKWSPLQNLTSRDSAQLGLLEVERKQQRSSHLKPSRRTFDHQMNEGLVGVIEHSRRSLAWKTPAFRSLGGCETPTSTATCSRFAIHPLADDASLDLDSFDDPPDTEPQHRKSGVLEKLLTERPAEARRRLHRNLGNSGPAQLADQLSTRGASRTIVKAAREYQCPLRQQLAPS